MAKTIYLNAAEWLAKPLPGCDPVCREPGNYENLADSMVLRLALFCTKDIAGMIFTTIEEESDTVAINEFEYCLNELQFELRKASAMHFPEFTGQYEKEVLQQWALLLIKKHAEDDVLDFIVKLKNNRDIRVMVFG